METKNENKSQKDINETDIKKDENINDDVENKKESLESEKENKDNTNDEKNIIDDDCELEFKVKILENKLEEKEDAFMRINAEYSNFRRRTAEEKSTIGLFANEKIMNEMIPVIDNFQRALEACEDKESQLYKGVDMVRNQLLEALKKSGLEEIKAEIGDDFDHNLHMAVMQEKSDDFESGKIISVLQKGYKLDKKVLRATMVKVSS